MVQRTVQTVDAKNEARQRNISESGASSTAQSKCAILFLDNIPRSSHSSTSGEEDEEQQLNNTVQKEVLMYFKEPPLSNTENPLSRWQTNAVRYPTLAKLAKFGNIHANRASVLCSS